MQKLVDGMLLYHGSYCEVRVPVLSKCAGYKDFGKGFYLKGPVELLVRKKLMIFASADYCLNV